MKVREGFVYHIRDEYFDLVRGYGVKGKTQNGKTFPALCCCKDIENGVLWMIPSSTNIHKYKAIAENELRKYGDCISLVFGVFDTKEVVFQVQAAFPILRKHVLHPHTRRGKMLRVECELSNYVRKCFEKIMELNRYGVKCTLTDVDEIKKLLDSEKLA